jgi:hypothetical protein
VDAYTYFLDLSMSTTGSETDRPALFEARRTLAELDAERGAPSDPWSTGVGVRRVAAPRHRAVQG